MFRKTLLGLAAGAALPGRAARAADGGRAGVAVLGQGHRRQTGPLHLRRAGVRPAADPADAMEEASCTDRMVLEHCRSGGPHWRGCWPVDLLLPPPAAGSDPKSPTITPELVALQSLATSCPDCGELGA